MDAVMYPDARVIEFFNQYLAPVQVLITSQPLPQQFNVAWTPTLISLDSAGAEQHRTVGYLPPQELIPSLMLGMAKSFLNHKQFDKTLSVLDEITSDYSGSDATPEAIYYRGVSRYKISHDLKDMRDAYEILKEKFKDSEWTKRATVYQDM